MGTAAWPQWAGGATSAREAGTVQVSGNPDMEAKGEPRGTSGKQGKGWCRDGKGKTLGPSAQAPEGRGRGWGLISLPGPGVAPKNWPLGLGSGVRFSADPRAELLWPCHVTSPLSRGTAPVPSATLSPLERRERSCCPSTARQTTPLRAAGSGCCWCVQTVLRPKSLCFYVPICVIVLQPLSRAPRYAVKSLCLFSASVSESSFLSG